MSNKTSDENVVNIEDDVKILEEFAEICKAGLACYDQTREGEALEHILAEREQDKKRIQELEKERDHWHGCFIVAMENGIAKEKVKNVLKNNRNEIFSATYLSREQFRPYEMQIERINKIEQELIGEDK